MVLRPLTPDGEQHCRLTQLEWQRIQAALTAAWKRSDLPEGFKPFPYSFGYTWEDFEGEGRVYWTVDVQYSPAHRALYGFDDEDNPLEPSLWAD